MSLRLRTMKQQRCIDASLSPTDCAGIVQEKPVRPRWTVSPDCPAQAGLLFTVFTPCNSQEPSIRVSYTYKK